MASTSKISEIINVDECTTHSFYLTDAAMEATKSDYNKKLQEHYLSLNVVLREKILVTHSLVRRNLLNDLVKRIKSGKEKQTNYKIGVYNEEERLFINSHGEFKVVIPLEEWFDIAWSAHIEHGHPDSTTLNFILREKYSVNNFAVDCINKVCVICLGEDKPYYRCALDLIPMVFTKNFAFTHIMVYEDLFTGYKHLRPLSMDTMQTEICMELFTIFMDFGPPRKIFISRSMFELSISQVQQLAWFSPFEVDIVIIDPDPEKIDRLKQRFMKWIEDNDSPNWAIGCYALQWEMNNEINGHDQKSPFSKVFKSLEQSTIPDLPEIATDGLKSSHSYPFGDSGEDPLIVNIIQEESVKDPLLETIIKEESVENLVESITIEESPVEDSSEEDLPLEYSSEKDLPVEFLSGEDRIDSPIRSSPTSNIHLVESSDSISTGDEEELLTLNDAPVSEELDTEDPLAMEETLQLCVVCNQNVLNEIKCIRCSSFFHMECGEKVDEEGRRKCRMCFRLDQVFG